MTSAPRDGTGCLAISVIVLYLVALTVFAGVALHFIRKYW